MLNANDFARQFNLHACVNNKRFSAQIAIVQEDAQKELKEEITRLKDDLKKAQNEWAILYKQIKGY